MALTAEDLAGNVLPRQPILEEAQGPSLDEQLDREFEEKRGDVAKWAKVPLSQVDNTAVYRTLLGNLTFRLPYHGYWYGAEFTSTPEKSYLDTPYVVTKDDPDQKGAIDFGVGFVTTRRRFFTEVADAVKAAGVPAELVDAQSWQEAYAKRARLDDHLPQLYAAYRALRKEGYSRKSLVL